MRERIFVLDAIRSNRRRIILGVFVFFLVILAELTAISLISFVGQPFELTRFLYVLLIALGITAVLSPLFALWAYRRGKKEVLKLFRTTSLNGTDWRKLNLAVENVSIATGSDRPEVKVVDLGGVNALSLARGNKDTLVLVTRGAVENLDRRELEALIAHEVYHVMSHDTWLWLLGLGMGKTKMIEMIGGELVMLLLMLYIAFYCALAVLWIPLWLAFYLLVLPRNRDVLADAQAVMITRDPEAVASSAPPSRYQAVGKASSRLSLHKPHVLPSTAETARTDQEDGLRPFRPSSQIGRESCPHRSDELNHA